MQSKAATVPEYLESLPEDRKAAVNQLRQTLRKNLPKGFAEVMAYGMIGYMVPKSLYPAGYHCNPDQPLPFIGLASQKQFIALYHMGLYGDKTLLRWFTEAHAKLGLGKLDMGKSCIRFKRFDKIPFGLIGELAKKIKPAQWIAFYEKNFKR